ncbi:MAG TPA: hypothetical protein PLO37_10290 [Candidatus Hydrogenedentes bacterium]|nr:hypothetical protein [Candidatus Hydrogenedentota bacterium]HPG67223.1 hypothetical protein [Candidatus Hydrogenedentota bacterium]
MKPDTTAAGRVLRCKEGYNPNSSSIGSQIPTFLAFAAGSGALSIFVLHLLDGIRQRLVRTKGREQSPGSDGR